MSENSQFVPVDLRIHRSQVIDLNVEYMNWVAEGISEHYKTDVRVAGTISVREYVASTIDKLCSDVPPQGIYYLLEAEDGIIGMGALRRIRADTGETKRMYVRPRYRGKGYCKALLDELLQKAKEFGYRSVYLDPDHS